MLGQARWQTPLISALWRQVDLYIERPCVKKKLNDDDDEGKEGRKENVMLSDPIWLEYYLVY